MELKNGKKIEFDLEELLAQRFEITDRGLLKLTSKQLIKEELGRSPDIADAMALTCYGNNVTYDLVEDEDEEYLYEGCIDYDVNNNYPAW